MQHEKIFIAPEYVDVEGPLIFLAGPIQGAPDWQKDAMAFFRGRGIHVASPRRPGDASRDFSERDYHIQVDWEHHYLEYAALNGVIMFWLAKEAEHVSGRAYAQTTRFELGEAIARHYLSGIKVAVGIEDGFSNARYLMKTIAKKAPDVPLSDNLEKTCQNVLALIVPW